jgi:hypothetical protein
MNPGPVKPQSMKPLYSSRLPRNRGKGHEYECPKVPEDLPESHMNREHSVLGQVFGIASLPGKSRQNAMKTSFFLGRDMLK